MGALGVVANVGSTLLDLQQQGVAAAQRGIEAEENEKVANDAAADAIARGEVESGKARREGTQLIAKQRVAYATSGIDGTSGTAAQVAAESRAMSELDAQTLRNNAMREAWGFKQKAKQIRRQESFDKAGDTARAVGTVLTGAGKVAGAAGGLGGG